MHRPHAKQTDLQTATSRRTLVKGCGCKSWYCPGCGFAKGMKLRREVHAATKGFTAKALLLTLTLNPRLFGDAESGLEYVRFFRCVSRFVKKLRDRGHVSSGKFFYVVEFHKSGWPHFHVLLDTAFIPIDTVRTCWDSLGVLDGDEQVLGYAFVSPRAKFQSAKHAVNYVTKYLTKYPEEGYPSWVLDSERIWKRYGSSRNFFQPEGHKQGETDGEVQQEAETVEYGRVSPTARGRVALCGSRCVVVEEYEGRDKAGREVVASRWLLGIAMPRNELLSLLSRSIDDRGAIEINEGELRYLRALSQGRKEPRSG